MHAPPSRFTDFPKENKDYIAGQFPASEPWMRIIRIILVVLAVFVAIFFLLSLLGHPVLVLH